MTDLRRSAAAAAVVLVAAAGPVAAQYAPSSTTTTRPTTTTTRPTTTTTERPPTTAAPTTTPTTIRSADDFEELTEEEQESTTTSEAPPPSIVKPAPPSVDIVAGETVAVPVETDDVFDPDVDPEVTLSTNGDDATTVQAIVTATVDEDGNLVIEIEVPEDTPESIITVTITAVDSRGVSRTIVYLFPVKASTSTTSTAPDEFSSPARLGDDRPRFWSELEVVPPSEVPEIVRQLQASVPDEATEQALLAELRANPKAQLVVHGGKILVSTSVPTPADEARPFVAGLAVALAGVGLLVLRRRPSFVKGTR